MISAPPSFASRFATISARRSPFCMGCDPSPATLDAWGLEASPAGLTQFVDIVLEAAEGSVGIVKPQVAFFEAFGPAGIAELARLIRGMQASGILVIADAKRGDIGSSMEAYARAWIGEGGFGADAVTANAYLGAGTLTPLLSRAASCGAGVFTVVRSSNPEGAALQDARQGDVAVADALADALTEQNAALASGESVGPAGAVIGATLGEAASGTVAHLPASLFLVPGIGAQGAGFGDLEGIFGEALPRVIPTSSRAVLAAGPRIADLKAALADHVGAAMALRG
ncbi:orotidine-5'-phosphate decarboxylase [Tropicimonas sp. IMCC34011]|uniref:orotidine-5'-phosphate decarboxylase n=1 Tax=Tropicimonas sp. IMCC34011 TaxID=2248759 RepID=UPI0018E536C3|nr:orotidine-5'-phosphate decarboxylase [Tropicimonas sp. IMCC34011]